MGLNIDKEVAHMQRMTVNELRQKFADVFGEQTQGRNKQWLIKRIAWRMQANEEGGLSDRAFRCAMELANDADLRLTAPRKGVIGGTVQVLPAQATPVDRRLPMIGTLITRKYKGHDIHVKVLPDGFEYEGERHKSLSAIAKQITGSHWNGFHFFRLNKQGAQA